MRNPPFIVQPGCGETFSRTRLEIRKLSNEFAKLERLHRDKVNALSEVDFEQSDEELVDRIVGEWEQKIDPPRLGQTTNQKPLTHSLNHFGIEITIEGSARSIDFWPDKTLKGTPVDEMSDASDEDPYSITKLTHPLAYDRHNPETSHGPSFGWSRKGSMLKCSTHLPSGSTSEARIQMHRNLSEQDERARNIVDAIAKQIRQSFAEQREGVRAWIINRRKRFEERSEINTESPFPSAAPLKESTSTTSAPDEVLTEPEADSEMPEGPKIGTRTVVPSSAQSPAANQNPTPPTVNNIVNYGQMAIGNNNDQFQRTSPTDASPSGESPPAEGDGETDLTGSVDKIAKTEARPESTGGVHPDRLAAESLRVQRSQHRWAKVGVVAAVVAAIAALIALYIMGAPS